MLNVFGCAGLWLTIDRAAGKPVPLAQWMLKQVQHDERSDSGC
jgi:hypothetical protein